MRREAEIREAYENLRRFISDQAAMARIPTPVALQMTCLMMALEWVLDEGESDEWFIRLLNMLELWAMVRVQ